MELNAIKKDKVNQEELTKRFDQEKDAIKQKENSSVIIPIIKDRHQSIGSRTFDEVTDRNLIEGKLKNESGLESSNHRILRQIAKNQQFEAFPTLPTQTRDRNSYDVKVKKKI